MHIRYFSYLIVLLEACILSSCSIKEDRIPCPCYLTFSTPQGEQSARSDNEFLFLSYNHLADRRIELENTQFIKWDDALNNVAVTISKGDKTVAAVQGLYKSSVKDAKVLIEPGHQSDSLECHSASFFTLEEEYEFFITRTKHYCTLTFNIESENDTYPYYIEVTGSCDGLDLITMEPHRGEFNYIPSLEDNNHFQCRVPRQWDDSLTLILHKADDTADQQPAAILQIGQYMKAAGYDWSASILEDLSVDLRFVSTFITITIEDWQTEIYSDVI